MTIFQTSATTEYIQNLYLAGNGSTCTHETRSGATMYGAGVLILAGTDANAIPHSPLQVKHGEALHRELKMLGEAELSTADTLRAATSLPARNFGLSDRGSIEVGKRADLLLISDDSI